MENYPIDFIITWVDGNDLDWQKEKAKYSDKKGDQRNSRYRDWNTLKYLLRSVEKNAPWVNKVFLVTYGHLPSWLNVNNPKLVIIKHEDYLPKEYLPTFSSRTIDMNFHRIKELSEHFVYFNDDMILLKKVKETDFFKKGLPCETTILRPAVIKSNQFSANETTNQFYLAPIIDMSLINKYFKKHKAIIKNLLKWYSPIYGREVIKTLSMSIWNFFPGIREYHCCYSYLKETYSEVWKLEHDALDNVCKHKFRVNTDYNHWIFSYWQMVSGKFSPRSPKFGFAYSLNDNEKNNKKIYKEIKEKKYKMVCLNDSVSDANYQKIYEELKTVLEDILSEKSSYEI